MSTCPQCHHDVITATYGPKTVVLDPHFKAYACIDEHHIYPEEGDKVFLSTALVEHSAVCSGERKAQAEYRKEGKAQYERSKKQG